MPDNREERFWYHVVGEDTVLSYREYLRTYPKGPHSQIARRMIARKCLKVALCVVSAVCFLVFAFLFFRSVCKSIVILIANR